MVEINRYQYVLSPHRYTIMSDYTRYIIYYIVHRYRLVLNSDSFS